MMTCLQQKETSQLEETKVNRFKFQSNREEKKHIATGMYVSLICELFNFFESGNGAK
jgi:hypothetical protein